MLGRILLWGLVFGCPGLAFADPCEGALPARGSAFSGQVRYIGDGDSLCVGGSANPATWVEVRLADFYAPELHAAGGAKAKRALERIVSGRTLQCHAGKRSYDRVVAQCTLNGVPIGDLLRRDGAVEGGRGFH